MAESTPEKSAEAAADVAAELVAEAVAPEGAASPESAPAASAPNSAEDLPPYARGLLRIGVPVAVTLATQRTSVKEIVELVPGAIIKFDKTCDQPLELCIGDQPIATGEVVKIGDKFGLRVGQLRKV